MLKYNILTAWRNFKKNKLHSFINVFGLSVGVAVCLMIFFFVIYENRWDSFHTKKSNIYRLTQLEHFPASPLNKISVSMYPLGPNLKQEYSQVQDFTRFYPANPKLISNGDHKIVFKQAFWVDSTFFKIFDFRTEFGDQEQALTEPRTAVLTETTARKIFGTADAVGKIFLRDTVPFKVNAVIRDLPENSHLQFEVLFSIATIDDEESRANWRENSVVTYLLLRDGTNPNQLEKEFPSFLSKHLISPEQIKAYTLLLQPLNKIHLGSSELNYDPYNYKSFNGKYVSTFSILAFIVLAIAFINFINLSIASSSSRAKEVGIKKTLGALVNTIAFQFIGETIFLTLLSFTIAVLIATGSLSLLNSVADRNISLGFFMTPVYIVLFYIMALAIGVLAGLYPSFYISSFSAIKVLKGKVFEPNQRFPLRNVLVTAQFSIAIILIIATLLVNQQLQYMRNQNPGFEKDQVMVLPASFESNEKREVLENVLSSKQGVRQVCFSGQRMGSDYTMGYSKYETPNEGVKEGPLAFLKVDERFIPLYKLQLTQGRNFSQTFSSDLGQSYIINESLAKQLGWKNPIGKGIVLGGGNVPLGKIIGVVKDFHFTSMKTKIQPMLLFYGGFYKEVSIKINPQSMQQSMASIKQSWNQIVTDQPFEYSFLDQHLDQLYKTELQFNKVTNIAAGLSIFIACLGVLGLISIIVQQKIKEIGIRKVLGATVYNILLLFSKDVIKLIVISSLIAIPLSWWVMNNWLDNFAYRVPVSWWTFLVAIISSSIIALLTVALKCFNAAVSNPVKSLRSENQ